MPVANLLTRFTKHPPLHPKHTHTLIGDEMTISYLNTNENAASVNERQERLTHWLPKGCTCTRCCQQLRQLHQSSTNSNTNDNGNNNNSNTTTTNINAESKLPAPLTQQ
jgi:hypothetical protein